MLKYFVDVDRSCPPALAAALGPDVAVVSDLTDLEHHLAAAPSAAVVVMGPCVDFEAALEFTTALASSAPLASVLIVRQRVDSATLTRCMRAGVKEAVPEQDLIALTQAVARVGAAANALATSVHGGGMPMSVARGKVHAVFSPKGGAGKTTIAVNLATVMAREFGQRVALVDLDLESGDVAISTQIEPTRSIHDAVALEASLDLGALRSLMTTTASGVAVLPAPGNPAVAADVSANLVTSVLALLVADFDHVVVDCPPAFTPHVLAAFDRSDTISMITSLDLASIKNMKLALDTMARLRMPASRLRVIVNRDAADLALTAEDVQDALGVVLAARIPESRDVQTAPNTGRTLAAGNPSHPVVVALRAFAATSIVQVVDARDPAPARVKSARRLSSRRTKVATV